MLRRGIAAGAAAAVISLVPHRRPTDATTRLQTMLQQGFSPAKEKLVALGGSVSTERVGGTDEVPVLHCVGELGGQRLSATSMEGGRTELEQRVARQLFSS